MPGFDNNTMYADNVDFRGVSPVVPQVTTDGQLLIGSTATPHIKVGTLGSSDSSITWTVGSGTITGQVTGGTTSLKTLTPDSGGAQSPTAGNINTLGSGSITTVGSGSTVTTQLTGLTNHAVLVGAGTTTITKLGVGTNGQVLLGATAADPAFATLTSSDGSIAFTTGANSLSLQVASGTAVGKTITGDTGGALSPTAGNWNIQGGAALSAGTNASVTSGSGSTLTVTSINTAKWIVDATANRGTQTTIQAAITAASSGETVFIRPGTYTENITLKAGVNLTAFGCDASLNGTGHVIISGTCTLTAAGTVTISGIQLQTNSAALLAVTGTAASVVTLNNCYLNCTNNTGITFSSSDANAQINIFNCKCDTGTTGIAYFSDSSAGTLSILQSEFLNTGASSTANTKSAGQLLIKTSTFRLPITYSSSNTGTNFQGCAFNTASTNTAFLTTSGTGIVTIAQSSISCGTASCASVGTGTVLGINQCIINTSNTNALDGAGTINYSDLSFTGTSFKINVTTQNGGLLKGGQVQAPTAGFIGEQLRATLALGSATSVTNNTAKNVTSVSLTAGIWDVTGIVCLRNATTGTGLSMGISTTSATLQNNYGDDTILTPTFSTATSDSCMTCPALRITLTATTTVYLVVFALFTVGTPVAYGRISATRVG